MTNRGVMTNKNSIARDVQRTVSDTVESVREWAAPRVHAAAEALSQGYEQVAPKIQEGLETAK